MTHKLLKVATDMAKHIAIKSQQRAYLGAIGVRSDGVLVSAHNGHYMSSDGRPGLGSASHAEARCARKMDKHGEMYVARVTADGVVAMARPCPACQVALRARRVCRVFYTITASEYGVLRL